MTTGWGGSRARSHGRLIRAVLALDLFFIAGTALFIHEWAHLADYGPAAQTFINFWLVQLYLGAENVVATWYASMLFLAVALAALLAFAVERKQKRPGWRGWRAHGWTLATAVFIILSLDEIGSFHERLGLLRSSNSPITDGIIKLGLATACLAGVLFYVRRVGGDEVQKFRVRRRARRAIAIAGVLLTIGAAFAPSIAAGLPVAANGIPENWFPAAVLFVVARRNAQRAMAPQRVRKVFSRRRTRKRRRIAAAVAALMLSAYFGAGLYGYSPALAAIGWPHVAVIATAASAYWLWKTL
jgi:hypothetical protein